MTFSMNQKYNRQLEQKKIRKRWIKITLSVKSNATDCSIMFTLLRTILEEQKCWTIKMTLISTFWKGQTLYLCSIWAGEKRSSVSFLLIYVIEWCLVMEMKHLNALISHKMTEIKTNGQCLTLYLNNYCIVSK